MLHNADGHEPRPVSHHDSGLLAFRIGATVALSLMLGAACSDQELPTAQAPLGGIDQVSSVPAGNRSATGPGLPSTVRRLLALEVGPVAIAHRGMGANRGEDPERPVENTVNAVRQGFDTGAAVVELDLQMTADGEIVMWHDDFLEDLTCIRSLTRKELAERAPHIASFQAALRTAVRFNQRNPDRLAGLLTVDLKPTSPLCDPDDTAENDGSFVSNVVRVVRQMDATDLLYFNSMSPVLLGQARDLAPEIPRQLTLVFLQFLSAEQVEEALGLPVKEIDKSPDYGLRWAEVGQVFRVPGYQSVNQAIATAFATASEIVSYDLLLLGFMEQSSPGSALQLVLETKALGLHVFAGDVSTVEQWSFGQAMGVGALYTDDVPLGVRLQPPLN